MISAGVQPVSAAACRHSCYYLEHLERTDATRFAGARASARPGARELHGDDKIRRRFDTARANRSQGYADRSERARWCRAAVHRYGYGDDESERDLVRERC